MKKLLIWLLCLIMLVSVAACGDESEAPAGDTATTVPSDSDATTPGEDGGSTTTDSTTTQETPDSTTGKNDPTKKPTDATTAANNEVNWEDVFGDEPTTTQKGDKPTTTKKPTTTSTTKPTTTTTKKPIVIDKVSLPAEGTDVDGRGRIFLTKVALKDNVATFVIRNKTDEQKKQWITEETNYVTYACYDKDGKELKGTDALHGYFYLGCLEEGEEVEFKVTLPKGTASVKLTGAKIVYWTPWS